ncbi:hypothetical protein C0992_000815 [Termitomyces sp. T32_za158]|nr:hypothetical protein C0992_000815 [Termitomyces sp. T32_za158]
MARTNSKKPEATAPETVEKTIGGDKNGGKRVVPTVKAPRYYPAEDVRIPKKSRKSPKPASLRSTITPGTVLILLAGRFRGKRVVFLKQLESGLLLVTGPYKVNGVPLRRVNQAYVIATSTKLELEGLTVDEKINDAYFAKAAVKGSRSAEEEFFEDGKPKAKEPLSASRSADQKEVDKAVLAAVKKTENLSKYLKSSWDIAVALPIPPELPAYSTTIILTTIIARFALLPVSIWGKRRAVRMEEHALPELERMKPRVYKHVFEAMQSKGIRGDKEHLKKYHKERSIEALTKIRKDLFKKYRCSPIPSIVAPVIVQLPVFVLGTVMLQRLSIAPTPFDSESFLTLTTLMHPDSTLTLPVVLGMLTMANVESSNWLMNTAERERAQRIEEQHTKAIAEGAQPKIRPKSVIKSGLRILSVARIAICAIMPGSVTIYWVTSAAFGLLQTWFFDWQDIRRRRLKEATRMQPPLPVQLVQPTQPRPVGPVLTKKRK